MIRAALFFLAVGCIAVGTLATGFGTIRGVVHDQKHRPIPDATVSLKAKGSDYAKTTNTDASGEFIFDAVPLGEYSHQRL